jgi:hypothetical protein
MRVLDIVFGLILGTALSISAALLFPGQVNMIMHVERSAPELLPGLLL